DRPAEDIIQTEAEIAESIAVAVGARLAPSERARLERRPTRNAAAYDHYLRGQFERSRRTTDGMQRAIREYDAALALDPTFVAALAWKGATLGALANTYYDPTVGV